MLKQILKFKTVLMFSLGLSLFCPGAFAQWHNGGYNNGYNGQRPWHGTRYYYHNGNWNRNGWYGWGAPAPVWADGVLVSSLPPGYTTVVVQGQSYYYGNNLYFRQMAAGGFTVVTLPIVR